MKSPRLSLFFMASMVVGSVCACSSDDPAGTSGAPTPDSGGTSSTGGNPSSGGSVGDESTGGIDGTAGSGGAQESGGAQSGGSTEAGGASNSGGTSSAGGNPSSGGSGGDEGIGGDAGSGGTQDNGEVIQTRKIETRGLIFDALETVSAGEPVLLLHGFPETSLMWTDLLPLLSAEGYHCLAPDQRGYSPGARPTEVDAYKYDELIEDAFALGSELGERFHLVAHDWGANVAWLMLEKDPSRIASFTAISIPHYGAWAQSVYDDEEMAWYLGLLDTWMTPGEGEDSWTPESMRNMWTAKPADQMEKTIAHMMEPGAMTAALNWYRASDGHKSVIEDFGLWEVNVPALLIHGSEDVGERSVTETAALMTGSYRVVRPKGGHFIVDEQPEVVAQEVLAHLRENPIE